MQKFRPLHLLAAVAMLAAAYTFWWYQSLGQFKTAVAAWSHQNAPVQISGTSISFSGFPYRHEAIFSNAIIKRQRSDYQAVIRATQLRITRTAWSQNFFIGEMATPLINVRAAALRDGLDQISARADAAQFSVRAQGNQVQRLSIAFENFATVFPANGLPIRARVFEFHGREKTPSKSIASADPRLPTLFDIHVSGSGVTIAETKFSLTSVWEITGEQLDNSAPTLPQWRTSGGTIELKSLELKRGTVLDTTATASISFDGRGQVSAAGTLKTVCAERLYAIFDVAMKTPPLKCGTVLRDYGIQRLDGKTSIIAQ